MCPHHVTRIPVSDGPVNALVCCTNGLLRFVYRPSRRRWYPTLSPPCRQGGDTSGDTLREISRVAMTLRAYARDRRWSRDHPERAAHAALLERMISEALPLV